MTKMTTNFWFCSQFFLFFLVAANFEINTTRKIRKLHHMKHKDICYKLTDGTKACHPFEDVLFLFGLSPVFSSLSPIFCDFYNTEWALRWQISMYTTDTGEPLYPLKALVQRNQFCGSFVEKTISAISYEFLEKKHKRRPRGRQKAPGSTLVGRG